MTAPLAAGALQGVRVLDLVDGMGAYATRLLRGLGADVVCVEAPGGSAHRWRRSLYVTGAKTGAAAEGGASLYFLHYRAGMRGVTLDITADGAHEVLERLVRAADIVIDNGQLAEQGYDLDALAGEGAGRAIVSITPFGLESPRAHWVGGDLIAQGMSGMLALFGYHSDRPARFGPEQASELSGLAAALGALITLYGARHDRGGSVVDVAAQRVCALVTFQSSNASMYEQFGFDKRRAPRTEALPAGLYRTRDGYFAMQAWRKPENMVRLLEAAGEGEGIAERFAEVGAAIAQDPAANESVHRLAARSTRAELLERIQAAGNLGLPVQDARDLLEDAFLRDRGAFVEVEAPGLPAPLLDAGAPVRLGASPYVPGRRPPLLGEHNAEVYRAIGIDEAQLADLAARGVV